MRMKDVLAAIPEGSGWSRSPRSMTYTRDGSITATGVFCNLWVDTRHRPSIKAVEKQLRKLVGRGLVSRVRLPEGIVLYKRARLKPNA